MAAPANPNANTTSSSTRLFLPLFVALLLSPFYLNANNGYYETKNPTTPLNNDPYRFVQLPQGRTAYKLHGRPDEPLIVFVHGFSSYSFVWDALVDPLVRSGFQVLQFDLYGRGYSDAPHGQYDTAFYVTQLAQLLYHLDETRDKKITLVGHSMGGGIASTFAYYYPHLIHRLVIGAPAGFPMPMPLVTKFVKVPILSEFLMTLTGRSHLIEHVDSCYMNRTSDRAKELIAEGIETIVQQWDNNPAYRRALSLTLQNFEFNDLKPVYESLGQTAKFPITLLWGEHDEVVPFELHKQAVEAMPNAQFVVLAKTAHDITENTYNLLHGIKKAITGALSRNVNVL